MIWHGIVRPTATTEINHLTTIKTPRKSPVNRLNGYLFLTALAFASGGRVQDLEKQEVQPNKDKHILSSIRT